MADGDKPVKGTQAFSTFTHSLGVVTPRRLTRSRNARRRLRALIGTGR